MKKRYAIALAGLGVCLLVIFVTWLNLPWRPDVTQIPPDSGFYAYIGKAILHGQLPYRDVWDDKPPLGYYLNALALALFGQTTWGVWWSGVAWISICTLLFFVVIRKLFGNITAGVSCLLFVLALMNPQIFQGANLMEVYALAPQIGIIGIDYLYFSHRSKPWLTILVGVLTACSYLIKQPAIMLGVASVLLILVSVLIGREARRAVMLVGGFLLGFIGLVALVSIYWVVHGSFKQFLDGLFLQGVSFIGGPQSSFIHNFLVTVVKALPRLSLGWLYLIAILAAGLFIVEKVHPYISKASQKTSLTPIELTWLTAVIALPLEAFSASLGGKYYGHYFITMLPAVITSAAYPIWVVVSRLKTGLKTRGEFLRYGLYGLLVLSALAWAGRSIYQELPSPQYTGSLTAIFHRQNVLNDLESYIVQTTQPTDKVLVWHIHLGINFVTDRYAPTRFLYPLNLFIPPSEKNTKLNEFVDALELHPPELIVVQKVSSLGLPFVNKPLDKQCAPTCTPDFAQAIVVPQIQQQWLRLQQFFEANYAPDAEIYDWIIYRRLTLPTQ